MELTKLQIRKLVKAGKLREDDFPAAFEKTAQGIDVSLRIEGGVRVFDKGGAAIADIDAARKITMLPSRQEWVVEVTEHGFIRLYKYNEETGGQK